MAILENDRPVDCDNGLMVRETMATELDIDRSLTLTQSVMGYGIEANYHGKDWGVDPQEKTRYWYRAFSWF